MAKKRILYFVPEFPKISETFIEREISKLIDFGNLDITVLSLAKASGSTSNKVLERTVYRRLGQKVAAPLSDWGPIPPRREAQILESGSHLLRIAVKHPYFFIKCLGYTKIIAKLRPNHIHVHFLSWPSTMVMIAASILKIPFSISAHAKDVFVEGEYIPQKIKAAKFISICNSYAYNKALELAGKDVDKSKVKLIYHGVDPKMFTDPAKLEKSKVPTIFLGGTRLVEKKGIVYMIEASKLLKDRGITHRVDLVGPGPLYQNLLDRINQLELQDTVFIHRNGKGMPFEDVLDYYKIADFFVLPSIETGSGDVDGVPTVVIEAAMAKLPIISTNAGAITDLIEDGVTGLIIEQKNPQAIADAIERLLSDKAFSNELVQNAYTKAVNMFDLNKNIGQLEELLK